MAKKDEYKLRNEEFLAAKRMEEGVRELQDGVLYRVVNEGAGCVVPRNNSVVTVHYVGTFINGREFDNSRKLGYPEAFRVSEVVDGFRLALLNMHVGDRWMVYIPYEAGYGKRANGNIPGYSTLVFDIELVAIM